MLVAVDMKSQWLKLSLRSCLADGMAVNSPDITELCCCFLFIHDIVLKWCLVFECFACPLYIYPVATAIGLSMKVFAVERKRVLVSDCFNLECYSF